MKERTRARGWVVQSLYAWEARGGGPETLVPVFQSIAEEMSMSQRNRFYADVLIRILARKLEEIDATIRDHLENWTFERLSVLDRNILRIGVAELIWVEDVPRAVTIREMLRLAERYGTPESPRFINGVLDAVVEEIQAGGDTEVP